MRFFILFFLLSASAAVAQSPLARPSPPPAKLPDERLYHDIFLLQENAKWRPADKLIRQIEDPILMGYVLFQRYMHPTGYRSKWPQLRDWLKKYADHPEAARIYRLAERRKPRGASMPKVPWPPTQASSRKRDPALLFATQPTRKIKNRVRSMIRRERPTKALAYIQQNRQRQKLSRVEFDFLKSRIARSYYIEGKIDKALTLAQSATRSRRHITLADWHAGLAAFRLGKIDLAVTHFEALAKNRFAGEGLRARAAYWAARGLRQRGKIKKAEKYFHAAAVSGAHFYALLATQHVTNGLTVEWHRADTTHGKFLTAHPALKRAAALRDAGRLGWAQTELLFLKDRLSDAEARALLTYAREHNYPAVQLALAARLGGEAGGLPLSLYEGAFPVPHLAAANRQIDRALLFALIRQESRFKASATSHAGARGLMQIMPQTAAFLTGERELARREGRDRLLDGAFNMKLGQQYLGLLLSPEYFDNNLILAVAAYNAGPGNMRRWRKELTGVQDPLLFIESIPAPETRLYVQKVMANMAIYRLRLRQEASEHRILAAESWPLYQPQDAAPLTRRH